MNHSSHLLDVPDYPPSSGVSEVDSLSDSDWLDLSSNRESDDNDSVMSGDSDAEDAGVMRLSRRSSISIGSSRDGDVDAWEGFVEESGDEGAQGFVPAHAMPLLTAVSLDETALIASQTTVGATDDPSEDQRVKAALDQSMISTLSSSRSSTASAHASLRDLRLSFPDPLTSSQNELNRSYEKVTSSDITVNTKDPVDNIATIDNVPADVDPGHCEEDPGLSSTTPAVTEQAFEENKDSFDVMLYGSSSSNKWSFISALLEKVALASDHILTEVPRPLQPIRCFCIQHKSIDLLPVAHFISIYDRTGENVNNILPRRPLAKRPSLAIVYLPTVIQTPLPTNHTFYLPILKSSASDVEAIIATREWDQLSIPSDKVVRLGLDSESPIFNGDNVNAIQDEPARHLLRKLLYTSTMQKLLSSSKKRSVKGSLEHLSPAHAVTLWVSFTLLSLYMIINDLSRFALMSLIVGFAMNTAFRKSTPPTPTTTTSSPASTFWGISGPEVNHTSVLTSTLRANPPVLTTHKEQSLSIFDPGSTSLAITSNNKMSETKPLTTPVVSVPSLCIPSLWTKVKSVKDVIVDSGTKSAPEAGPSTPVVSHSDVPIKSESKTTALSLVIESLTEVVDAHVERFRNEYRVNELIESLDELARAIRRQTLRSVDTGKGKAREIRDNVQYRHERARGKAKELRRKGEEIISLASTEFTERTNMAKKRAREITTNLAKSESWRTYQQVQANWMSLLEEKGREGSTDGRASKKRHEGKCRSGKNLNAGGGPCRLFSRSLADFYLA
ncbi:hypothetical protein H0H92_005764 [Tricholoma furcatifolium]|nr:hypothetical protein H0H92_005764 [Tricholoma furcatifolium]